MDDSKIPTHRCDQCWPPGQVPEAGHTVEELKAEARQRIAGDPRYAEFVARGDRIEAERKAARRE